MSFRIDFADIDEAVRWVKVLLNARVGGNGTAALLSRPRKEVARRQFQECENCAAKPGMPQLCPACLHNREIVSDLGSDVQRLECELLAAQQLTEGTPGE